MKSLMMFCPNPTDATSFYRAVGPIQELKRKLNFTLQVGSDVNWATLKGCDAIFVQRGYSSNHVQIVEMAKANGKKVWVDYDDDLFSVPASNRTYKLYSNEDIQNNIVRILLSADYISVSTEQLKKVFNEIILLAGKTSNKKFVDRISVIPNAYDESFCFYRKKFEHQNKLITWRGSSTHDKDLMTYTSQMKSAVSNHLDWTFNFIGSPFWHTIEELESIEGIKPSNVIVIENLDPVEYWKMLWMTKPALIMTPLWDCPFNRSKSNIAWIEGLHAGAITLAPDWEEWRRPGVLNYNPSNFGEILDRFMRGEFNGERIHKEGWDYLMENLTLNRVNHIREELLMNLLGL